MIRVLIQFAMLGSLALAIGPAHSPRAADWSDDSVRASSRTVHAVALRKNEYIRDLKPCQFRFSVGGKPIAARFVGLDVPTSIVVVTDVSPSLQIPSFDDYITELGLALVGLDETRTSKTEYRVVAFSSESVVLSDFVSDVRDSVRGLHQAPGGRRTALYDACKVALNLLSDRPTSRKVIVVISDGQDNASSTKLPDLRKLIRESGVLVYTTFLIDPLLETEIGPYGAGVMTEISKDTGGLAVGSYGRGHIKKSLRDVGIDLRNQYTFILEATSSDPRSNSEVKVDLSSCDGSKIPGGTKLRFTKHLSTP